MEEDLTHKEDETLENRSIACIILLRKATSGILLLLLGKLIDVIDFFEGFDLLQY